MSQKNMDRQNVGNDSAQNQLPPVLFVKSGNNPSSMVNYELDKDWGGYSMSSNQAIDNYIWGGGGGNNMNSSKAINNYVFEHPWNRAINTPLPENKMYSGYNVGNYL